MKAASSTLSDAQRRRRALKRLRYRRNKRARQTGNYPSPRTSEVLTHQETTSCSSRRPHYLHISPPSYSPIKPAESPRSPPDFSVLFPERYDLQTYPDFRTQKSLDEFCELRTPSPPPLDLTSENPTSSQNNHTQSTTYNLK
ncbi:uncharacterized protein LOC105433241 isoform X2 [Pogonomyrmex barbatus]|uniref:Uncharacterized protein LOC105433241 isoform X1 n=1 Tax=Pogonomyrmex barbatus TaxID=144034 RepID=A0A6I9WS34_9HYME|nr:uncharacterized protein LOC105433241 isoform X1 [Pogonomyrmex barbatus]XP_011646734.1 uncharacterized protein LOC105433241 isoform X2 [Pogonomyrmex barbatus]